MIFSITCILERLGKNIICVPGDQNIKSPQSDGALQAGFMSAPGLAEQLAKVPVKSAGRQESLFSPGSTHPLSVATEALLALGDVARAHWLSVKHCQIELLVITAGKLFSQYF